MSSLIQSTGTRTSINALGDFRFEITRSTARSSVYNGDCERINNEFSVAVRGGLFFVGFDFVLLGSGNRLDRGEIIRGKREKKDQPSTNRR